MKLFDDVLSVIDGFSKCILFFVLLLTSPIWVVPYVIYSEIKNKKKRGGRQ